MTSPETAPPPTRPATPPAAPARPRLERPREDRIVSGVCSGLARHLGVDPIHVRFAAVILAFLGGAGLLVYLAGLVMIPEEGEDQPIIHTGRMDADGRTPLVLGALVLAVVALGVGPLPWGPFEGWGWLLVLAVGGGLVWVARRTQDPAGGPVAVTAAAPQATAVTEPLPATAVTQPLPVTPAAGPGPHEDAGTGRGGRVVLGALLLLLGTLGLLATALDADPAWDTVLAVGVLATGAVALLSAPFGGARWILPLGFLAAGLGATAAATDVELRGGIGDRTERPVVVADVPGTYRLAVGSLTVDLRELRLPQGTTTVRARAGVGEVVVQVPRDVTVVARGRAGAGVAEVLGEEEDGGGADVTRERAAPGARRLVVDARVGMGSVVVEQDAGR